MEASWIPDSLRDFLAEQPEEWEYSMRRSMQEIVPGIYLGPYACARSDQLPVLKAKGITHIVCVRQHGEARFVRPNFPDIFTYLVFDISDEATENILQHIDEVSRFLDNAISTGGKVLMHGNAGISRSGSLLIAYIMRKYQLSYSKALQAVQLRRFCVSPNQGFAAQLMEYEAIHSAQTMIQQMRLTQQNGTSTGAITEQCLSTHAIQTTCNDYS
eukprot:m.339974 g.339974  ORF g.339974 m.339974 type:complete len:215 (+) comp20588_c0_seq17:275-919(+)